jgi:hypothetical protein
MKIATVSLAMALGLSLMLHAVTFHRLNRPAPEAAVRPQAGRSAAPASRTVDADRTTVVDLDGVRTEATDRTPAPTAAGASSTVPPPAAPTPRDPELTRILAEQDRWNDLLADLGKLSAARRQRLIADERYAKGVVEMTADFMSMHEPQRSAFIDAARAVLTDLEQARREMEQVMRAEPRPTREQMQAVAATYRGRQTAAQDRLAAQLDAAQPLQQQFSMQLPQWLRSLGGTEGRWGGAGDRP